MLYLKKMVVYRKDYKYIVWGLLNLAYMHEPLGFYGSTFKILCAATGGSVVLWTVTNKT
jgi:hypothetical protein